MLKQTRLIGGSSSKSREKSSLFELHLPVLAAAIADDAGDKVENVAAIGRDRDGTLSGLLEHSQTLNFPALYFYHEDIDQSCLQSSK